MSTVKISLDCIFCHSECEYNIMSGWNICKWCIKEDDEHTFFAYKFRISSGKYRSVFIFFEESKMHVFISAECKEVIVYQNGKRILSVNRDIEFRPDAQHILNKIKLWLAFDE